MSRTSQNQLNVPQIVSPVGKLAFPALAGLVAALVTGAMLNPAVHKAIAIVDLGGDNALRSALDLATSHPVIRRANAILAGSGDDAPQLAKEIDVVSAEAGGAVAITAAASDEESAAHRATALAEALISEHIGLSAAWQVSRDADAEKRLSSLRAAAAQAHDRLAALGGSDVGQDQTPVEQIAKAAARVEAIRAVLKSGSPPLSDEKDVSAALQMLQSNYLDLIRRLAVARGSLGDRHVTVIALQEGIRQAGDVLTAEWKRSLHQAQSDLDAARQRRSTTLNGSKSSAGALASIESARRASEQADAVVRQAEAARQTSSNVGWHLVTPVPLPGPTVGWSFVARALLSLSAAAAAFGLILIAVPIRALDRHRSGRTQAGGGPSHEPVLVAHPEAFVRSVPGEDSLLDAFAEIRLSLPGADHVFAPDEALMLPAAPVHASHDPGTDDLRDVLRQLAADVATRGAVHAPIPSIMVAAHAGSADTTEAALVLAAAATDLGLRAILLEGPRSRPGLAAAAELDGEPLLVRLGEALHVGLPAETARDVCLLPLLQNGDSMAAALARSGRASVVGDLPSAFDILVIDGGEAPGSAAGGLEADWLLRVGPGEPTSDSERFLDLCSAAPDNLLGTIVGSTFISQEAASSWPFQPTLHLAGDKRQGGLRSPRTNPPRSGAYATAARPLSRRAISMR